jgi:hypothetical protein
MSRIDNQMRAVALLSLLAAAYAPMANPWGQEPPLAQIPSISTVLEIQQLVANYMRPMTPTQIRDFAGGTLRLNFHDAAEWEGVVGTGGSDGCLDLTVASNAGLERMVDEIDHYICDPYCPPNANASACLVSRADCWWWVGEVVVELTGGPTAEPDTFLWGRQTTNTCPTPRDLLPGAEIGWSDFHRIMVQNLGLDVVDGAWLALDPSTCGLPSHCLLATGWPAANPDAGGSTLASAAVALIGAHTVGRMRCPHSGFHGTWDSTPHVFDNEYFRRIARKSEMDQYEIDAPTPNSTVDGTANNPSGVIHFWTERQPPCAGQHPTRSPNSCGVRGQCTCSSAGGVFPEAGAQNSSLVLLNADLAFAADLSTPCTTSDGAGLTPPSVSAHVEAANWATQFAGNKALFFQKFRDAYRKAADIGHNPLQLRRATPLPVRFVGARDGAGNRGDLPLVRFDTDASGVTIATDLSALHDHFLPCYLTTQCTRFTCNMFPVSFYYDTGTNRYSN